MKRRPFINRLLIGSAGGLLLGLPGISRAGTRMVSGKAGSTKNGPDEMILISAGSFLMGTTSEQIAELSSRFGYHPSWLSHEAPQRDITLPDYKIDKYPVTNKQYHEFCQATGHTFPEHWANAAPQAEIGMHPVRFVNKDDALAYAKWAGKRLPTEAEWEKAARGTDGRLFPWGNEFNAKACCWNRPEDNTLTTDPVDAHPAGASPYGLMDMAGNLFEWCNDGPADESNLDRAVKYSAFLKGGAWITTEILDLRPAARNNSGHINNKSAFYGFRCIK